MVPTTVGNVNPKTPFTAIKDKSAFKLSSNNTSSSEKQNRGAWLISGNVYKQREFLNKQPSSSQHVEDKGHCVITTQPSRNLVAGVVQKKLILFNVL